LPIDDPQGAMSRFEQLTSAATDGPGLAIANACTDVVEREIAAHERGDFEAAKAMFADWALIDDRRSIVGVTVSGEQWSAQARAMASVQRRVRQPIAVRGKQLALFASTYVSHRQDAGESEVQTVEVFELDEAGKIAATVVFDADDLDAAFEVLDARYAAGEGAPLAGAFTLASRPIDRWRAQDWEGMRAVFTRDAVVVDCRPVG